MTPADAFLRRAASLGLVVGLACACGAGSGSPGNTLAAPEPEAPKQDLEPIESMIGPDGRLVLPTASVGPLELSAAIAEDLELAGVRAVVIVEPEPLAEPESDEPVPPTCTLKLTLTSETIGFGFDSDVVPETGRRLLELVAAELEGAELVAIVGYSSAEGVFDYNVDLSRRRAESVRLILAELLEDGTEFVVDGLGPIDPIAENDTEAGRSQNRRVEISADLEREECVSAS